MDQHDMASARYSGSVMSTMVPGLLETMAEAKKALKSRQSHWLTTQPWLGMVTHPKNLTTRISLNEVARPQGITSSAKMAIHII